MHMIHYDMLGINIHIHVPLYRNRPHLQIELTKFDTTTQYVQSVLNHTTITSSLY